MKKLLFVFLLVLMSASKCDSQTQVKYVFQKNYSQTQENKVSHDIDSLFVVYGITPLSMDKWISFKMDKDNGYIEQKTVSKYGNPTLTVLYYKYVVSDSTYYQLKIRQTTTKK